jgi:cytoskeletal protein RodZ
MLKPLSLIAVIVVVLPALLLAQYYPRSRRGVIPGTPNPGAYNVAGSFHGKLKELTSKEIMIETDDSQTVSIHRSRKTKFLKGTQSIKASDIDIETPVTVDASEEVDLSLTAVSVTVDTPKKTADSK